MSEERAEYHAGQDRPNQFTLTIDSTELAVLNQGMILWLAELQRKKIAAIPGGEVDKTIDETFAITQRVCEKIDNLLGMK